MRTSSFGLRRPGSCSHHLLTLLKMVITDEDVAVVVTHPLSEFSQGGEKTAPILIRVLDSAPVGDFVDTPDESQSWA